MNEDSNYYFGNCLLGLIALFIVTTGGFVINILADIKNNVREIRVDVYNTQTYAAATYAKQVRKDLKAKLEPPE